MVTGGEDCYYRIWDEFGRLIYSSKIFNYPITTVSWAPNGTYFGVGSYNTALLCDYQRVKFVCLNEDNQIIIQNILSPDLEHVYETLEFNESVINFQINYEYLIVITTNHCYIYQIDSVTTPQIVPLKSCNVIHSILLTEAFFILVNSLNGINVIGYDGKTLCQFNKSQSIQPKLLNTHNICATIDTLAIIDVIDNKCIQIFDPYTATSLADSITHSTNIKEIALNISPTSTTRICAFIDNNKDLFIAKIHNNQSLFKLKTIVDSILWHPNCDILFALSDKQLIIWYYPCIVWCDTDLISYSTTKIDISNIGNNAKIVSIEGTLITIKKSNGDEEIINFSSLPLVMYNIINDGKWNKALRLCNICNDIALWGSLTGLEIDNGQIEIALQGLTVLEEPDKILFLKSIQNLPSQIHKDAELLLYRKNIKSAENILLQHDLIYRAVELNIRLLKFKRALQISIDYNKYIDIVIAFRNKYLKREEMN